MKLKQQIFVSLLLQIPALITASNLTTTLNTAKSNLQAAQNTLAQKLGIPQSNILQGNGIIQTTIMNNVSTTAYIIPLDVNMNQIGLKSIALAPKDISYIPSNAATLKIVDSTNNQLAAPISISTNTPYAITHADNKWNIIKISSTEKYTYKNTTNVPLIIKVIVDKIQTAKQVEPQGSYEQIIDPSAIIAVQIHANLASISSIYNPSASYTLAVNNNKLALTQSAPTGNAFINNSGWPILVNCSSESTELGSAIIQNGQNYKPHLSTTRIMVIPIIENESFNPAAPASFTISNNNGQLAAKQS